MDVERAIDDLPPGSRLAELSRRAFLRGSGLFLGVVAVAGASACAGNEDADVLGSPTTSTTAASSATSTTMTTGDGSESGSIPTGAELDISFTYSPSSSGGRVENPYVAVWIEDASGELVQALAVYYEAGRNARYLSELQTWTSTDGTSAVVDTVSAATRTPGDYALAWDGTGLDGAAAPLGGYLVCIEAAREHGPHSLIQQGVTIGADAFSVELPSDGELSGATADYRPA